MKNQFKKPYIFLLLSIILPFILIAVVSLLITSMSVSQASKQTLAQSNLTMRMISENAENNLKSLTNTVSIFATNPEIATALTSDTLEYTDGLASLLGNLMISNLDISNTFIFDKNSKTVCCGDGMFRSNEYFSSNICYKDYSANYWNSLTFFSTEPFHILSPCELKTAHNSQTVIPVVFRKIDNISQKRYIVFNVELTSLLTVNNIDVSEVCQFYIINKFTGNIFSLDKNYDVEMLNDEAFINTALHNPNGNFKYKFNDDKYFVSTSSKDSSMIGYIYISIIPQKTIYQDIVPYFAWLIMVNIIAIALAICFSAKTFKSIFASIKNIWISLSSDSHTPAMHILNEIEDLSAKAKLQTEKLAEIMPYAQQNYLVNYLNNLDGYINCDQQIRAYIENSFSFKYQYFKVILIQLSPASNFYNRFSLDEYNTIKTGFYNIVCDMFAEKFSSISLPAQNQVLSIILNIESGDIDSDVRMILKQLLGYLDNDLEYVTLSIGVGDNHSGIDGLKKSHTEALDNFIVYNTPSQTPVIALDFKQTFVFSKADEAKLFSALSSFDKSRIMSTIYEFLKTNQDVSVRELKALYGYILNTILKFIHINKISYMDDMLDFEIANKILNQPVAGIRSEIERLVSYISSQKHIETNFDDIYKYVSQNHSSGNLCLQELSNKFYMSQSAITRMIQKNTGLTFKELLLNIRVENAKNLLKNTNYPIDKIWEMTGFSTQRTFFRSFKSVTGMTPGQFKNL